MTDHRIWKVLQFACPTRLTDAGFEEIGEKERIRTVAFSCECGEGFEDVDDAIEHIQNHE